jgi:N6-adenosine-specific RNA methylase IME4
MNDAARITGAPLFAPLPVVEGGWACVAIDAALDYATWSAKGQGKAPSKHYDTHAPEALEALGLELVLAKHAWLFAWWPDPHEPQLDATMGVLGFKFSGKAFTWVKTLRSLARGPRWMSSDDIESVFHFGLGKTTRKNSESCWLGRRGKPKILSHSVREIIIAPRREHSRKPTEFYRRVEQFCPGPRLDLFPRETRPGWTPYGDEATLFDEPTADVPPVLAGVAL